jgi:hypothetical protein
LTAPAPGAFEPDLSKWAAWRPDEAARRLAGVRAPWYVAAGWALDLHLGRERREHEDLEIGVPAARFGEIAEALAGFELFVAGGPEPGYVWPLAGAGDTLETSHQTWVREPGTGLWRLDVFREPSEGDTWVCRRDERIRLPYGELIERTADGIPYSRPEVVLLFKAKAVRERDQSDFAEVAPALAPARRAWLGQALTLVHPGHPWLADL